VSWPPTRRPGGRLAQCKHAQRDHCPHIELGGKLSPPLGASAGASFALVRQRAQISARWPTITQSRARKVAFAAAQFVSPQIGRPEWKALSARSASVGFAQGRLLAREQ